MNNSDGSNQPDDGAGRPLVLPEKFDGIGNFEEWISHFESIAALNKWGEEEKSLWIRVRLTEKAHVALTRLPSDTIQTYEETHTKALKERFELSSKQEVYKAEFDSRRNRKTESWGDFGDELIRLVDKAFPKLQFEWKEQLALSRYLDQLEPIHVSFGVKQCQPKTVHEAVSSILELESYLAKPRSESVSHVAVPDEPPVESIQAVQRDMIGAMQKLVKRVEKLEAATKQRYPVVQGRGVDMLPRQGRQWNPGAQIICRRCNQPGHYAQGCAAIMEQQGMRGQGTQGSWHQGNDLDAPNMPNVRTC